ncbi:MAG: cell wall hydrolase [Candidatus Nanopelagicus sp.]
MKHLPNLRLLSIKAVIFTVGAFFMFHHSNLVLPSVEAKTTHTPTKKLRHVDAKQLKCLATNIYYEAGGESEHGKAAVARVVMNRVAHGFANTPCNVIYQSTVVTRMGDDLDTTKTVKVCQFSWVCENKGAPNKNTDSYKQSERIAYQVLANNAYTQVVSSSTLFFHNLSVAPAWSYARAKQIGNHVFYEKGKKRNKHVVLVSNQ